MTKSAIKSAKKKRFSQALQDAVSRVLSRSKHKALSDYTPSLQIGVIWKGQVLANKSFGLPARYFDLASLTKVIFTVTAIMDLAKDGRLRVIDPVQKHWPAFPYPEITIKHLLTHTAGFRDWAPYFQTLRRGGARARRKTATSQWERLERLILKEKLERPVGKKAVYSDIDFLILGAVLVRVSGIDLHRLWKQTAKRHGLRGLHFRPLDGSGALGSAGKGRYAATENSKWRKQHLQGEVHDDNTWTLMGVSSHAGLFGDLRSVLSFGKKLRRWSRGGHRFLKRALSQRQGDWALGYTMPSKEGSTSGQFFSPRSIGHTGFTGTSLWFDPQRDLFVTMLSNRVNPSRRNVRFRKLRPLLHDEIVKIIDGL
jgi:serine-type D-Ala-D-Ala carboxypeptidase